MRARAARRRVEPSSKVRLARRTSAEGLNELLTEPRSSFAVDRDITLDLLRRPNVTVGRTPMCRPPQ
jgi:hypothetical protein